MTGYQLPLSVDVAGAERRIRTDYRVILDICAALEDPELNREEKAVVCIGLFFLEPEQIPLDGYPEAVEKCFWFINCGAERNQKPGPKLVDWEQDLPYIVAPINRVAGTEIRAIPYDHRTNEGGMHWWTFISYYYEIGGDCVFSQIVRVRDARARGKLTKEERSWYSRNRELVDFKTRYTDAEEALVDRFLPKGG